MYRAYSIITAVRVQAPSVTIINGRNGTAYVNDLESRRAGKSRFL